MPESSVRRDFERQIFHPKLFYRLPLINCSSIVYLLGCTPMYSLPEASRVAKIKLIIIEFSFHSSFKTF
jgi:hypothetical protein